MTQVLIKILIYFLIFHIYKKVFQLDNYSVELKEFILKMLNKNHLERLSAA